MGASKTCVDCGDTFPAFPKNTKRCYVCRILKDSLAGGEWLDAPAKCTACGEKFWPLRPAHVVCETCQHPLGDPDAPACSGCSEHNRIVPGLRPDDGGPYPPICHVCVESTKQARDEYVRVRLPAYRRHRAGLNRQRFNPPAKTPANDEAAGTDTASLTQKIQERVTS